MNHRARLASRARVVPARPVTQPTVYTLRARRSVARHRSISAVAEEWGVRYGSDGGRIAAGGGGGGGGASVDSCASAAPACKTSHVITGAPLSP